MGICLWVLPWIWGTKPCTGAGYEPWPLGTRLHAGIIGVRLLLGQARSLGLRSKSGPRVRLELKFMESSLVPRWSEAGSSGATMEHLSIEFILMLEWIMSLDLWDPVKRLEPWRLAWHWCNTSAVVHDKVQNLLHCPFPNGECLSLH